MAPKARRAVFSGAMTYWCRTSAGLIDAARIFDKIYVMTRGGPGSSAFTTTLTVYVEAFNKYDFGYASAISFMFQIVLVIIATVYVKRVMADYSAPRDS